MDNAIIPGSNELPNKGQKIALPAREVLYAILLSRSEQIKKGDDSPQRDAADASQKSPGHIDTR